MTTRRAVLALAGLTAVALSARAAEKTGKTILFLGGTGFLGPPMVRYAIARGHTVTLFNRGKTNPGLFSADVETLVGDRDGGLDALKGRRFDHVIDTSGYVPRVVRDSAKLLKESGTYLFVSSVSAFADTSAPGLTEEGAVAVLEDPKNEEVRENYGALKAACEAETRKVFGDRAIVVRPTLIVGPGDNTDRFTYWPVRIWRGGEVLAPGDPTDPVQIIDVRDLGEWCVRLSEDRRGGTYNAVGPASRLSIAEMLHGIRATTAKPVSFTWVDAGFLEKEEVAAWSDVPVWVPPTGEYTGFAQIDGAKAIAAGLVFRPLADTARDTALWVEEEGKKELEAGLTSDRETALLAKWKA